MDATQQQDRRVAAQDGATACSNVSTPSAILSSDQRRALIVMIDHHVGNFIVSMPVIEAMLGYFDAPPDLMVDERFVALARLLPSAGRILPYPSQAQKRRGVIRNIGPAAIMLGVPFKRYRCVIDFGGSQRTTTLTAASLAATRIGFSHQKHRWLYSHAINWPRGCHALNGYAQLLQAIGQTQTPAPLRLHPDESARLAVDAMLKREQPTAGARLAIIHAGAGHDWRRWPAERFAAAADLLVERHDMDIALIGAPSEQSIMDQVRRAMRHHDRSFPVSLPLEQLLALCDRAAILLSNESGPTHLAAATDLPIVTIFGPSKEHLWRPIREKHVTILRGATCDPGCGRRRCVADRRCLLNISAEQMVAAAESLLNHVAIG